MRSRRSFLAAGATGVLAASAGCLGAVLGTEPIELTASRAAPSTAALESTGYDEPQSNEEHLEETIDVGVSREVRASYWVVACSKDVDLDGLESPDGAFFVALSMPGIDILGRSFNPLEEVGNEELIDELLTQSGDDDGVEQVEPAGSVSRPILGEDRDVEHFEAISDVEEEAVELELSITSFAHEDDLLVLLGGHPAALEGEANELATLFESVEHPLE